jgi:hypothetical protein
MCRARRHSRCSPLLSLHLLGEHRFRDCLFDASLVRSQTRGRLPGSKWSHLFVGPEQLRQEFAVRTPPAAGVGRETVLQRPRLEGKRQHAQGPTSSVRVCPSRSLLSPFFAPCSSFVLALIRLLRCVAVVWGTASSSSAGTERSAPCSACGSYCGRRMPTNRLPTSRLPTKLTVSRYSETCLLF